MCSVESESNVYTVFLQISVFFFFSSKFSVISCLWYRIIVKWTISCTDKHKQNIT